jgi:hypothetical protein
MGGSLPILDEDVSDIPAAPFGGAGLDTPW